ncbi:MAG: hypothetical protein ACOYVD_09470 [Bacillota bacterium]
MFAKRVVERVCIFSILALTALVFSKEVISLPVLDYIEGIFLVVFLITSLLLARGPSLYFSIGSLVVGHFFLFYYQMGAQTWFNGITKNLPLGILLILVPVLSIPLKIGGYLSSLNGFIGRYAGKKNIFFPFLSLFIFVFSSFTNLGGIRVSYDLIREMKLPHKFLSKVFTAGFAACVPWSPYFGSANLILYYTDVSFSEYFIYGFTLGIIVLAAGNIMFARDPELQEEILLSIAEAKIDCTNSPVQSTKVKILFFILFGLIVAVLAAEQLIPLSNMMLVVSLTSVVYATFWSILIKESKAFLTHIRNYSENILQFTKEVLFFLSVGFLGVILANTPLQYLLQKFLTIISGYSIFFLVEFIIIITLLLSSIGFHQVITITALSLTIDPFSIGLTTVSFSLTLLAAWTVCIIVSPFVPYNILMGGLLQENSFKIGWKWNRNLGLLVTIISGFLVMLVNQL